MTVVHKPNGSIRLWCDLCPVKFQDVVCGSDYNAAKSMKKEGWKTIRHDKDHYSNICPDCAAKIKED